MTCVTLSHLSRGSPADRADIPEGTGQEGRKGPGRAGSGPPGQGGEIMSDSQAVKKMHRLIHRAIVSGGEAKAVSQVKAMH